MSALCTSVGLRSCTPFRMRLMISRSFSRYGLVCVNTPGLCSLLNLVEVERFSLDGDLWETKLLGSESRTRFGQCCSACE